MSVSSMTVGNKTKYKIVLLGDQYTGKTSIIQRFINDKFEQSYSSTIGIDFLVKNICRQNKSYRLQLWDTAGQQRFKSLIPSYLKDSNCALIVFDANNRQSFQNASKWFEMYEQHKDSNAFCALVGNKIDIENHQIKDEQINAKVKQLKVKYFGVSAKCKIGVQQMFLSLVDQITQKINAQIIDQKAQQKGQQDTAHPAKMKKQNFKLKDKQQMKNEKNSRCC